MTVSVHPHFIVCCVCVFVSLGQALMILVKTKQVESEKNGKNLQIRVRIGGKFIFFLHFARASVAHH